MSARLPAAICRAARRLRALASFAEERPLAPSSGVVARLVVFASASMSFLAVVAVAIGMAADRAAQGWAEELARSATVRVSAPPARMDAAVSTALRALRTTPGVADARALTDAEQRALLEPWLGPDAPLDELAPPRLIVVVPDGPGPDPEAVNARLSAELPGPELSARYDDHGRWRAPLLEAARALRALAWSAAVLAALSAAAMVTLAARATLAANGKVVDTLRLLGASNDFIARAFVRRYALRAMAGGAAGALAAALALEAVAPLAARALGGAAGLAEAGWVAAAAAPLLAGAAAWAATRMAVLAALRRPE
ncbi:cell division protein FtsX [Oceanicella actignis]|uniref:cell division protein FtsX n=1 Tax=Oceanicella actignis TaxID=1189325 RepID=UPI0011E873F3|nr:cell division protein FtsX [Oceanicella actignis]TYO91353.1 cell division transport system permease protein [Oceanicella actignis]